MQRQSFFGFWAIVFLAFLSACGGGEGDKQNQYHGISGETMGTYYKITYFHPEVGPKELKVAVDSVLGVFNASLSTYIENSTISQFNQSKDTFDFSEQNVANTLFEKVLTYSDQVYEETDGAFDPTVMPLVNAWGFGFEKAEEVDSNMVDSLMQYVGFEQLTIENQSLIKSNEGIMLDFSAIAKGLGVDFVGAYLDHLGIQNYLIEVGGELVARGKNKDGLIWRVGIEVPKEEAAQAQELHSILQLEEAAMATSGNYRNYYLRDGKRYAHTISPKTGHPIEHQLLSSTVVHENCMLADAYATAFMVMGLEESIAFAEANEILVHFIHEGEDGNLQSYTSPALEKSIQTIQ